MRAAFARRPPRFYVMRLRRRPPGVSDDLPSPRQSVPWIRGRAALLDGGGSAQ